MAGTGCWEKCSRCDGEGRTGIFNLKCKRCNGSGKEPEAEDTSWTDARGYTHREDPEDGFTEYEKHSH